MRQRQVSNSVVFALAETFTCVFISVRIDVTQLLLDRAIEAAYAPPPQPQRISRDGHRHSSKKRKSDTPSSSKSKKAKTKPTPPSEPVAGPSGSSAPSRKIHVTLKLGPKPSEPEDFPCCLCTSMSQDGLLNVHEPPLQRRDAVEAAHNPKRWMAHEICANVIPETWVDEVSSPDGTTREKAVFGVDGIVKDRWNLVSDGARSPRLRFKRLCSRNVPLARKPETKRMVRPYSAPKGNAQRLSTFLVHGAGQSTEWCLPSFETWRRK